MQSTPLPPAPVRPIPYQLLARLRSQVAIASLSQVVTELVANSIDAGAREVAVRLDCSPSCLKVSVADNGSGVPADSLRLLGQHGATSKLQTLAQLESGLPTLGFRGEALAAICETAVVEIDTRARGTFETHSVLLRGGVLLKSGLALEQRPRAGTVVTVSDLFFNQPVKRKALLGAGLQRELDRCREAVQRLALIRPQVTFTVFDCTKRTFVLKLLKGRLLEAHVAQVLGLPSLDVLAAVAPAPPGAAAPCEVSGLAALPPHGAPSATRQYIYVNGHCVRAPPVAKAVDALFQAAYTANARLAFAGGEELQAQRKAANRHAAFVLQLRCRGDACEVSFDADSRMVVQFREWEPVLAEVQRAVLAAWRPVLTLALMRQLAELEGAPEGGDDHHHQQPAPEPLPFQQWVLQEQNAPSMDTLLLEQQAAQQQAAAAAACGSEQADAEEAGGSGRQRNSGRGQPPTLAGAKHALVLTSRSLRFGGLPAPPEAPPQLAAGPARQQQQRGLRRQQPPLLQQSGEAAGPGAPVPPRKRVCIAATPQVILYPPSHHGHTYTEAMQEQRWSPAQQRPEEAEGGSPDSTDRLVRNWRPLAVASLTPPWQQGWGEQQQQQQREQARLEGGDDPDGLPQFLQSLAGAGGADLAYTGAELLAEDQGQDAWQTPVRLGQREQQGQALSCEEQLLLEQAVHVQPAAPQQLPRPQSAPPIARQCRRAVHTNPLQSLQAAAPAAGAAGGVRGLDTVSGLGWRQQKRAAATRQASAARASGEKSSTAQPAVAGGGAHIRKGLRHGATGQPMESPSGASPPQLGQQPPAPATVHVAVPAAMPQAPNVPAPSFLQPGGGGLDALLSTWRNPVMVSEAGAGQGVLSLQVLEAACFAQLKPAALTREQLERATALQQVDTKFIPIVSGPVLALVDQHAADERVQLERLRDELLGQGGATAGHEQHVGSMPLRVPQPLALSEVEAELLQAYGDRVAAWGWRWVRQGCGGAGGQRQLVLTHSPLLFGSHTLSSADLRLYLHHLSDTAGATGLPAGVVRVLNSKACRSAVMFGDALLPAQCAALVEDLKSTQLCFACAHGRPTTAPLVDLRKLTAALALRRRAMGQGMGSSTAAECGESGTAEGGLTGLRAKLLRELGGGAGLG